MTGATNGRLVFDSDRAAAKVGRRSASVFGRTLLYRSDRWTVDVVVHSGAADLRLFHGQVLDERSGAPLARAEVTLDDDVVRTDDFGQFSLSEIMRPGQRVLRVRTDDHELICPIPADQADE